MAEQKPKTGIETISRERDRQVAMKGYFSNHDMQHERGELAQAASAYAQQAANQAAAELGGMTLGGPVPIPPGEDWWNPSKDAIRNLAKAGALIAAEIDRLNNTRRREEAPRV